MPLELNLRAFFVEPYYWHSRLCWSYDPQPLLQNIVDVFSNNDEINENIGNFLIILKDPFLTNN